MLRLYRDQLLPEQVSANTLLAGTTRYTQTTIGSLQIGTSKVPFFNSWGLFNMDSLDPSNVPYRQIRALYDDRTITVYQAYSASIAIPAVREQRLNASPDFLLGRMTWIKPSWCWMMCFLPSLPNQHNLTPKQVPLRLLHQGSQSGTHSRAQNDASELPAPLVTRARH